MWLKVKNEIIIDEKVKQVILSGNSKTISVQPNNAEIIIDSGTIEEINIEGSCTINISKNGIIDRLITNGNDVKSQGDGKNNIKKIQRDKNISTDDKNIYSDKSLIEVKIDKEENAKDIVKLSIKCRNVEDLYGVQVDMKYNPSILIIEDISVDESLSGKLNTRFKDYRGWKTICL